MEFHQLRYFVAVAEVGSFSGAARRCNVAQPSLSQQVIKLEEELGCKLFDRLGRTIALTQAGAAMLPRARRILSEVRGLPDGLADDLASGRGELRIGAIPTMAPYLLPPAIARFKSDWPEARLTVYEDLTDRLVSAVVRAEIDLALTSTPILHEAVEVDVLFTEPLVTAVPTASPLAARRKVELRELERHATVFLDHVHCLGQQVHDYCRAMRVHPSVTCQATQLETAHRLVALGLGVCLIPRMFAEAAMSDEVRYVEVKGTPPARDVAVVTRAGRSGSFLAAKFIEYVPRPG